MPKNAAAENALGTLGAVFWSIQLIPQMWMSYRAKSTEGLSDWMLLIWSLSGVVLGVMVVVQKLNIPLILQPQLFSSFALVCWAQCIYYGRRKSLRFTIILFFAVLIGCAGAEAGLIYAIRPSYARGNDAAILVFGVITAASIPAGLIPQYYEIYKHGEVKGISIPFMAIDFLGAVCSDLSLVFHGSFQVLPAIAYTLVAIFDFLIIVLAWVLNPRAKRRREREGLEARAADGDVEEHGSSQIRQIDGETLSNRNSCISTPLSPSTESDEKGQDASSHHEKHQLKAS